MLAVCTTHSLPPLCLVLTNSSSIKANTASGGGFNGVLPRLRVADLSFVVYIFHLDRNPDVVLPKEELRSMCGSLIKANLGASLDSDITARLWTRLGILSCVNPLSAILLCPSVDLVDNDSSKVIMKGVADELATVIQAVGVKDGMSSSVTSQGIYDAAILACTEFPGCYSSMAIDVQLGKPTEINYFTGYVAKRATEFGIPTPHCSILTELVLAKTKVMSQIMLQHEDSMHGSWRE